VFELILIASPRTTSITVFQWGCLLPAWWVMDCFPAKISLCWSGGILFSRAMSLVDHVPLYNVTSCKLLYKPLFSENTFVEALYSVFCRKFSFVIGSCSLYETFPCNRLLLFVWNYLSFFILVFYNRTCDRMILYLSFIAALYESNTITYLGH
jgi:hypothetical protein